MTAFPSLLDQLADAVLTDQSAEENPHHRAILDTFQEIQDLDQLLLDLAEDNVPDEISDTELLNVLTDLVVERIAAGQILTGLLSTDCCCTSTEAEENYADDEDEADFFSLGKPALPGNIVDAALSVFRDLGDPDALASADLVIALRQFPGVAEDRWRYADLTQARLAQLLAPYEISTRDITLPDGRRRKSYRRSALVAALPA